MGSVSVIDEKKNKLGSSGEPAKFLIYDDSNYVTLGTIIKKQIIFQAAFLNSKEGKKR